MIDVHIYGNHSILRKGLDLCKLQVPLENIEAAEDAGMQVALPRLHVVVCIVSEASQVGCHRPMILHQCPENR